jgi:hydrogenase maturation protease
MTTVQTATIVACVGNIFLSDDGFGVEVAGRLRGRPIPAGVRVLDIGVRGIHLAYELLDGCALLILVDAAPHGTPPGTVSVIEVDAHTPSPGRPLLDGHGLAPDDVFALLDQMGGRPARTLVVACEPADVSPGIGLSPAVAAAVPEAVRAVEQLLRLRIG